MKKYEGRREQMHQHWIWFKVQEEAEYEQADQWENDQNEADTRVEVGEHGAQQEYDCGENEERVLAGRQYVELFHVEIDDKTHVDQAAQQDRPFPGEIGRVLVGRFVLLGHFGVL